jgi:hypothetical protein
LYSGIYEIDWQDKSLPAKQPGHEFATRAHHGSHRSTLPRTAIAWSILLVAGLLFALAAQAQMTIVPSIVTVAGNGTACATSTNGCGDGAAATSANLNDAHGVFVDAGGNIYVADNLNHRVRMVSAATGLISTVAGNGTQCAAAIATCGDGGAATSANLNNPTAAVVDAAGNMYIADRGDQRIRMVSAAGVISTYAGNGTTCATSTAACGDGAAATSANLSTPIDLALDSAGNLYIADYTDNRIRMVAAGTGIISTVAGNGVACGSPVAACGDGASALSANLANPRSIVVDKAGNFYISDMNDIRIRKVTASTGFISNFAGNGVQCAASTNTCGDGAAATSANLNNPAHLALGNDGYVYVADQLDERIRKINTATGFISTVAGTGAVCAAPAASPACGNGGAATSAQLDNAAGLAFDRAGNMYIADRLDYSIREVLNVNTLPVTALLSSSTLQNVLLQTTGAETITSITAAQSQGGKQEYTVGAITGCTVDGSTSNPIGTICTVPITFSPYYPGLRNVPLTAVTSGGNIGFGLSGMALGPLAAITPGIISTVAGDGTAGATGDGGAATSAELNAPENAAIDSAGNLYIADYSNALIRKVTASGTISTVAGGGSLLGDNGPATSALLNTPVGVALDSAGNIYIGDKGACRVRKVTVATGIITTIAGNGTCGSTGDGGLATSAQVGHPGSIKFDPAGNFYFSDSGHCVIREVNSASGYISTFAGNGTCAYAGDGGAATSASLNVPEISAPDNLGNFYIADFTDDRIRKVTTATGIITTYAGTGTAGYSGDGGAATSANLKGPSGMSLDPAGNLYFADDTNGRVRKIDAATGFISTVAGKGTAAYSGDGGAATSAAFHQPIDVEIDSAGNLFVVDHLNQRVREVTVSGSQLTFATSTVVGALDTTDDPQTATVDNIGNASLTIPPPGAGANPSVATYFQLDGATTCPQLTPASAAGTLTAGQSCTYAVDFAPTIVGSTSGAVVLTDNSLSVAGTTQSINMTATAIAASTTTTLATSGTPSIYAASVTITATVAPTVGTALPLGTVQFKIGAGNVGTPVTLNASGVATYTTSALAVGTSAFKAVYTTSSTNFTGSTSAVLNQVVTKAPSSGTITWATPAAITYGTALSVTQLNATSTLAGTFAYSPVSGTVEGAGAQTLTATFTPTNSTDYQTGTATVTLTVNKATPTVLLGSSLTPSAYAASITLTATVPAGGTGIITFLDVGLSIGTATISGTTATLTISSLAVGTHTLTASWPGDTNYNSGASSALSQVINRAAATVAPTSSLSPSRYGDLVAITITITGAGVTPTGMVVLKDGATTLGTLTLNGSGVATLATSTLAAGSHSLIATYQGDTNYY